MFLFRRQKFISGVLDDSRSFEEKLKDFRFEELAMTSPPVEWKEKPIEECRKYPIRNQGRAGSCIAHSKALELGILNELEEKEFVLLSARDIYTRRRNRNSPGMWGQDANQVCINSGATLEALMPSDNRNEEEMNKTDDRKPHKEMVGKIFRAKNWIALPFNIDTIASIVATGKGVNVLFKFTYSEWNRPIPVLSDQILDCHHSVVAIDYTLYQGKKALVIQDSWGLHKNTFEGRRIITEDWLKRASWASYFEDLSNWDLIEEKCMTKPKYRFKKDLFVGMKDDDVVILQDCLKWFNFFPRTQVSTGYFGGITRNAVIQFQEEYDIKPALGFVGSITRNKLNEIFG